MRKRKNTYGDLNKNNLKDQQIKEVLIKQLNRQNQ